MDDLSIEEAAVLLGMSPTAVIALLESGRVRSHLGPDGRRRRVLRADLEAHRTERFDLRQDMAREKRAGHRTEEPSETGDTDATAGASNASR